MKRHVSLSIFFLIFIVVLSGCSYTVYRELKHRYFTAQYPNWDDYKLEKFEDGTFKAVTTNKQQTCRVLISSYIANYLSVSKILLDSVETDPSLTLLQQDITSYSVFLEYTVSQPKQERVNVLVYQCHDLAYVLQYSCDKEEFAKQQQSIISVLDSAKCEN